jgi:HD-GYP domain-containing protein (c-di-GMP phosphodiesterase class II)
LKGEEIPFHARLFTVVDNWDALTTDRSYRQAWSHEKTINYMREQSGKRFDPKIVDVFITHVVVPE